MKNSVEIRSPYLDRDVINESMNFSSLETVFNHRKWILKNMAKKYLPNYLIARGKQGFSLSFSRVIPHLKEPSWDDELVKISGASLPQIWKLARNDQNHAMAAWSLMVINHFLVQKKLHISIGMSE
jgi:asparagine synthetase B (glutamine-hydrolysing)